MKFTCEICGADPSTGGLPLYRVNPTGEPGVWRCFKHLAQFQKNDDPELRHLVCTISGFRTKPLDSEIGMTCVFAGPGRGDCAHFVGLPGKSIPGQHDGPDDTVDVYGKPNGWCWPCWKDHKLQIAEQTIRELRERLEYDLRNL